MTEHEKFDEDYSYLRRLVVSGKVKLADAKLWLNERGEKYECRASTVEVMDKLKRMGQRANRDVPPCEDGDDGKE